MIPAGPDDVNDHRKIVLDVQTSFAHRASRTDDFVGGLAFRGQRGKKCRSLHRGVAAIHDFADERGRLGFGQIVTRYDAAQQRRELWEKTNPRRIGGG